MKIITMAMALVGIFSISTVMVNANASESSSPAACEGDGLYDGKNNPYSHELYKMCGGPY